MIFLSYITIMSTASLLSLLFPEMMTPIMEFLYMESIPNISSTYSDNFHSIACSAHSSMTSMSPSQDLLLSPDSVAIFSPNPNLIPNHEFDSPPPFPTHLTKYPINMYNSIWVTAPGALPTNPSKTLQYHLMTYMSTHLMIGLL